MEDGSTAEARRDLVVEGVRESLWVPPPSPIPSLRLGLTCYRPEIEAISPRMYQLVSCCSRAGCQGQFKG